MKRMWDFPTELIYIPLSKWIDAVANWVMVEGAALFGAASRFLMAILLPVEQFMLWLPWVVVAGAVGLASWAAGGPMLGLGAVLGLVLIGTLGLWDLAMMTVSLILAATVLAMIIGIPLGILMARSNPIRDVVRPVLDLMQTMPSFVYLIPALMLFGLGRVPALIATLIYAVPPVIRLTNLGIRQVAQDVVEAAEAFGSTKLQVLTWVQIPLALPTIMAGVNQTVMMAVAMVVIASMIGAGGLGGEVLNGIARLEVGRGFSGGISIVILAIVIDRVTQGITKERRATPLP